MNNTVTRQVLGKVMITSKGEYDSSKSYEILDVVTYQGSSYLSKKYNNDSLPTNANDWQLLAQKGDTYELSEEDLQRIAEQITSNANSAFNQNVKEKTDSFNSNASSKTEAYNTNATEKLGTYNSNHTAKLKEYNDNATSKLSAYNTNTVTKTTEYNSNHTDKLNAYNTNASNKVDVYNTNADTRLEEYNTNADNKIAEYDEHSKELNNKIVSIGNDYRMVKDQLLYTGEDTDTFIHLEDSAMAELQEIKVDGVCEQNTTKGNQLIDFASISSVSCNVKFGNDTLKITSNKSYSRASKNITKLLQNNVGKVLNFTFESIDFSKTLGGRIQLNILKNNGTRLYQGLVETSGKKVSYTIPNDFSDITSITLEIYSNNTSENSDTELTILKPLLYFENNNSYEPYTGGQPSPSPDYPQEIKTITDSLKVTSCGKNLLDYHILRDMYTNNGITFINNHDGTITVNGTATNVAYIDLWVENRQANTYRLSGCPENGSESTYKMGIIILPSYTGLYDYGEGLDYKSSSMSKFGIRIRIAKDYTANNIIFKPMLEIKSDKDIYEPYIESQIQAKLPEGEFIGKLDETYKDTLRTEYFPEEGQYHWMLDKKVGKYVFTGAEDFTIINSITGITQIRYSNSKIARLNNINYVRAISNYFTDNYSWENSWRKDNSVAHLVESSAIVFYSSNFSTATDFKQFLKDKYDNGNPVVVYYLLAKPYTLDLGVIDMPLSYNEVTNIFTDSDLLPKINAKYYRVFEKTIQNAQINEKTLKQEITDLNTTVSALDNRLKALETKTVEEPTESEGTV